jgi:Zn-dependent peptidase ImmA (M78 family)
MIPLAWRIRAKTKANEILKEVAPSCPLKAPVPINEVIEEYVGDVNVIVSMDDVFPEGVSAFSTKDIILGWLILINGRDATVHQRFSAAHELAHIALLPNQRKKEYCSSHSKDPYEKLCNRFAGHILMPEALVRDFYKSAAVPFLWEFARKFNVSTQAAEIELKRLGLPFKKLAS